jgi:hypothetical protein
MANATFTFITLPLHVCGVGGGGGPVYMQLTVTFILNFLVFRTKVMMQHGYQLKPRLTRLLSLEGRY